MIRLKITMNRLVSFILILVLSGCVAGEKATRISPGMTKQEVFRVMGKPDGYQEREGHEIYKYTNRLISGWSWDRADYSFIFKDDRLIEYGSGDVRERNAGGFQSVFIHQL